MIQAIIFDCFGVLTTEGWIPFKNQAFSNAPEKMRRATELSRLLDTGLISYREALRGIANMAGIDPEELDTILKNVVKNDALLNYIDKRLKGHYKIGLLSNVGDHWLYSMFNRADIALFDAISLSHQTGIVKPDTRAYQAIADKLGAEVADCIFIDDLERNVAGARHAGMQSFVYKGFEQFKSELEQLL